MQNDLTALTVTQLNQQVRSWLELEMGNIMVIGELSNLSKPRSGHFYFTLKDPSAQLRCVYFRNHHASMSKHFQDGQQVLAQGKLSLYEARGDYQLIVYSLTEAGLGALYCQFEELKAKLQAQGLFAQDKKKSIPRYPTAIGIITSATGAALRDVLITLARRFPLATAIVYDSEVQGKDAAKQLIKAIKKANQDKHAEVLILARGGGSIEDLWAFNDEQLALTISSSTIPIVSGVGHETDFTIADFVADLRAATPTAAAETVTPNQFDLLTTLTSLEQRMLQAVTRFMQHKELLLSHCSANILSPGRLINKHYQTIDCLEQQLNQSLRNLVNNKKDHLYVLVTSLHKKNPMTLLQQFKAKLQYLEQQLTHNLITKINGLKHIFSSRLATLHAVSPLATLERGYAIATYNQTILCNSNQVKKGDNIDLRLAKGHLVCKITYSKSCAKTQ
jgi:exodeoxyribonuclease VII large subunit